LKDSSGVIEVDTTYYIYDGMNVVAELDGHLDLKSRYIYANGMLVGRINDDEELYQYFHDGLGSITMICDSTGEYQNLYVYDDFGNFRMMEEAGSVPNHYYYTGQERDESPSGLYNLRARYYAAGIGRFTQEDPVLESGTSSSGCSRSSCNSQMSNQKLAMRFIFPQELNPYTYVSNDPINFVDITGVDRYDMCKNQEGIAYNLCRNMVDFICGLIPKACCRFDAISCLADLLDSEAEAEIMFNEYLKSEFKCIPKDEKLLRCFMDYEFCLLEIMGGPHGKPYQY
jgi:RHS repeat-associated protein